MSTNIVRYQNATQANYIFVPATALATDVPKQYTPETLNLNDLYLSRVDTDMGLIHNKALVTVNGIIHSTVYDGSSLWIEDGNKSMVKSENNHVGLVSFMSFSGNLKKEKITDSMLYVDSASSAFEKVVITTSEPVSHPVAVLGGYLQFEAPGVFHRLSDNSFELNLNKTKYIERLYELHRYSNVLEKLGLPVTYGNTPSFDETLAVTDTYIRKFLKLNNTLIVSLPTAVTTEQLYFSQNNGPGYFSSLTAPSHCLFSSTGKLIEYFRMKHTNAWAGCVVDYIYENLILSSIAQSKIDIINASSKPGHLRGIAGAHLLKISAV